MIGAAEKSSFYELLEDSVDNRTRRNFRGHSSLKIRFRPKGVLQIAGGFAPLGFFIYLLIVNFS